MATRTDRLRVEQAFADVFPISAAEGYRIKSVEQLDDTGRIIHDNQRMPAQRGASPMRRLAILAQRNGGLHMSELADATQWRITHERTSRRSAMEDYT
jgi:hypothetical protein